jgi:hypothetical protein
LKKPQSASLDLGPPGYAAFVAKPAQTFTRINSEAEYAEYSAMFESRYAMYMTLHMLLESSISSVKTTQAAVTASAPGSVARAEALEALQQMLAAKGDTSKRWDSAFKTLHWELLSLKQQLALWTSSGRAAAKLAAVAAAGASQQQQQQQLAVPGAAGPFGHGKGLMMAGLVQG